MGKKSTDSVLITDLPAVSPERYRDAMSHFAGAVHILTTRGGAGVRGTTVSACCSLSDNPPTLLVCLMKQHGSNRLFIENGHFCINTLGGQHQKLSDIFAGRGDLTQEKRFAKADWKELKTGSPVLQGALASFDCRLVGWHEHATHYILYGRVVDIQRNNAKEALLYLNRGYHRLAL
ncbi:MAG: Flavin reductase family protein [Candidatus Tokpelaia hoelldobleri]|uniref:Flavin reductase family protein n=1 Tax=Candidatus Tokpelaia hoelldobleri TaxID=1902579 RepID=A0A1U9JV56_9HYPH|nr:MAG: Flavin reductase family protein [Candidatus Tokpelaia hoelldoblerii]